MKLNRQMGIVVFIQNSKSNVIFGSGHVKVCDKQITTMHWNNYDPNLIEWENVKDGQYVFTHTGMDILTLNAKNPHYLKSINIEIDTYTFGKYGRLKYIIPLIENSVVTFNRSTGKIKIVFPEEINSDETISLFRLVIHFTLDDCDITFPVYKFFANDSDDQPIGWDYIELRTHYLNELCIQINPLDINDDYIVNDEDVKSILPKFGILKGDSLFEEKYDVNKDGRIDIQDIILVERETWIYDPPKETD